MSRYYKYYHRLRISGRKDTDIFRAQKKSSVFRNTGIIAIILSIGSLCLLVHKKSSATDASSEFNATKRPHADKYIQDPCTYGEECYQKTKEITAPSIEVMPIEKNSSEADASSEFIVTKRPHVDEYAQEPCAYGEECSEETDVPPTREILPQTEIPDSEQIPEHCTEEICEEAVQLLTPSTDDVDRVYKQLQFSPKFSEKKYIYLLEGKINNKTIRIANKRMREYLHGDYCELISDHSKLENSTAIVFTDSDNTNSIEKLLKSIEPGRQIVIWNRYDYYKQRYNFNWTASSTVESNIPDLKYIPVKENQKTHLLNNTEALLINNKSENIAIFEYSCNNYIINEFLEKINNFIKVDDLSECNGNNKKEKKDRLKYKFVFAFEDKGPFCAGYISNKIYDALENGVIPIVIGRKRDFEEVLPTKSFIHISDFDSVEELAKYVLDLNKDEYEKYHLWRRTQKLQRLPFFPRLCSLLHASPVNVPKTLTGEKLCAEYRIL